MADLRFSVPTENPFVPLSGDIMARENFQTVKRKRNNTDQGESQVSHLMNSSSDDKLNYICNEIRLLRGGQEEMNKNMQIFQQSFRVANDKLSEVIDVTNKNTNILKTLAYKSIDLEARSRRNNLVFWGLLENYHENCFEIIRDLIQRHLDINAGKMYIARAHRLGPRKIGQRNPKRPIIVNFRDFCDTELIMSRAHLLKQTPFSVAYDLPKEINEARKKLWDELRSIKRADPRVKFQILYPARLIVDGKLVRDEFPDWGEVLHRGRTTDFAHIEHCNFDQPDMTQNTHEYERQTREPLFTNLMNGTLSEKPTGARDHMTIHQGRVEVAHSSIEDTSSYSHGMEVDTQNDPQTYSDPLTLDTNSDLPNDSSSSVIIHEAEIHTAHSENDHVNIPVSSSQEIFRPYNIDNTISKEIPVQPQKTPVPRERRSRPAERVNRRTTSSSPSISRLDRAARDTKQWAKSKSNSKARRQENVTLPPVNGNMDNSQQGTNAGTPSVQSDNEHINS